MVEKFQILLNENAKKNVIFRENTSLRSYTGHSKAEQKHFSIHFNQNLLRIIWHYVNFDKHAIHMISKQLENATVCDQKPRILFGRAFTIAIKQFNCTGACFELLLGWEGAAKGKICCMVFKVKMYQIL